MKKAFLQGSILAIIALLVWFGYSQIDYLKLFKVKQKSVQLEQKLGDLIWDNLQHTEDIVTNDTLVKTLDKLIKPICEANDIERDSIKVHIIAKDEVNAFALPNKHLVVYTGLITDCKRQEAVQGVLGHEIAHITHNHVMKKLSKEIGFSVLLSTVSGGNGGQMMKEIFKTLSSSAYDRSLEKEADISSVDYMIEANIDPKPLTDFMYQMAQDKALPDGFEWISTHPESEERAKYIMDYIKGKKLKSKPTLSEKEWKEFKDKTENY